MFNKLKECDIYQFVYSFTFKSFYKESTNRRMYKLSTYLHQKISNLNVACEHVALEMFVSHYTMSSHVIYVSGKYLINYLNWNYIS